MFGNFLIENVRNWLLKEIVTSGDPANFFSTLEEAFLQIRDEQEEDVDYWEKCFAKFEGGLTKRALDELTVCPKCGGWLKGGECENCNLP